MGISLSNSPRCGPALVDEEVAEHCSQHFSRTRRRRNPIGRELVYVVRVAADDFDAKRFDDDLGRLRADLARIKVDRVAELTAVRARIAARSEEPRDADSYFGRKAL